MDGATEYMPVSQKPVSHRSPHVVFVLLAVGLGVALWGRGSHPRVEQAWGGPVAPGTGRWPQAPSQTFDLIGRFACRNLTSHPRDLIVNLDVPRTWPPCARVDGLRILPRPRSVWTDRRGNHDVRVVLPDVPPGALRKVTVSARFRVYQVVFDVDARRVARTAVRGMNGAPRMPGVSALPPQRFTVATSALPAYDPRVRATVARLLAGEHNPWYRAVALFDYVRRLRFQMSARPLPVPEALRRGLVQCSNAAALLVTLDRAAGLAARFNGGVFVIDGTTHTDALHAWTDVFMPFLGWVPIDPTMARFDDVLRLSRLGEQVTGYLPIWRGSAPPFVARVRAGHRATSPAVGVRVSWRYRFVASPGAPVSLCARFPIPAAALEGPLSSARTLQPASRGRTQASPSSARSFPTASRGRDHPLAAWQRWQHNLSIAHGRWEALRAFLTRSHAPPWIDLSVRGLCDMHEDHFSVAEHRLDVARRLHPCSITCTNLAAFYLYTKQISRSLRACDEALHDDPLDASAWQQLINVYVSLDAWDGVARVSDLAAVRLPRNPDFYAEAAQAYGSLHRWSDACARMRRAVALVPRHGWMHAMLGQCLSACGARAEALRELRTGLRLGGLGASDRHFFAALAAKLEGGH